MSSQAPRPMRDCPRWNSCSVPICPLDPDWKKRSLLPGEGTCPWLTEAVKPNAASEFALAEVSDLLPWMLTFGPLAAQRHKQIGRTIERARTTGSTLANSRASGERLAASTRTDQPEPGETPDLLP